ncbi:PEP-CTERM sorting domain-containing protein [Chamaesiphon sp.]|uniref:PEP-CTERM sorting domain-containing protein n=1 Tax=Chamaesiphon sp. TaxID=2814140 RepID=UPI003593A002
MKIKSLLLTTSIAVGGIVVSGVFAPAQAFTIFFGEDTGANTGASPIPNSIAAEASFLSNLSGAGTETFEGFASGATASNINFPGVGTATISSTTGAVASGANTVGRFPVLGSDKYYEVGNGIFTINFANPVAAFGFYGTDIGDFNGQITLSLNDVVSSVLTVPNTISGPNGSALYYGLIAQTANETFNQVTFGNTNVGTDFFGFDNLTVGTLSQVAPPTAVPEPFSIIGTLVGGTAALRMRKKLKANSEV